MPVGLRDAYTTTFSGGGYLPYYEAMRAVVTYNGQTVLSSAWVPTGDFVPAPSLSLDSLSFARGGDGYVSWSSQVTTAGLGPGEGPCTGLYADCWLIMQARLAGGTVTNVGSRKLVDANKFSNTAVFSSGGAVPYYEAMRAVVTYNGQTVLSSAWVPTGDFVPAPSVALDITSLEVSDTGVFGWDVDVITAGLNVGEGPCQGHFSTCTVRFQARDAGGTLVTLGSYALNASERFQKTVPFTGTRAAGNFTSFVASVAYNGSVVLSSEVAASTNVQGGHDLDAALVLATSAFGATPLAACLNAFPVGTHRYQSSVNDQQMDCLNATQSGKTFAQFLTDYIKQLTPAQVTALLAAAGVVTSQVTAQISSDLDYGKTLPSGCVFTGLFLITCTDNGVTTTHPPISAPPAQDPVWENNQRARGNTRDNIAVNAPPPDDESPTPVPVPDPWAEASPADRNLYLQRTCVAYLAKFMESATFNDDDCERLPIFGTGLEYDEATRHDLAAITVNPVWLKLTYVKGSEKGVSRPNWPVIAAECAGMREGDQCDEYPFFSTGEGYPATRPDLLPVNGQQNVKQGSRLGGFYRSCPKLQQAAPGSGDRQFLVIPMPEVPTWTYCPSS